MNVGEWYRNNYGKIIFWVILPFFLVIGFSRLFAHVDLIEPLLWEENVKHEMHKHGDGTSHVVDEDEAFRAHMRAENERHQTLMQECEQKRREIFG